MHQPSSLTYSTPLDVQLSTARTVPLVIVGAGLVGLTLALDLARRGVASVVLEARQTLTEGSRAIVFAQRSLEILGRLGLPDELREKGVDWKLGRVFHKDHEVFSFDFQLEPGFRCPAFLNIQQTYIEQWLVEACLATGLVDLQCLSRVVGVEHRPEGRPSALNALTAPTSCNVTGLSRATVLGRRCAMPWTCPLSAKCSMTTS